MAVDLVLILLLSAVTFYSVYSFSDSSITSSFSSLILTLLNVMLSLSWLITDYYYENLLVSPFPSTRVRYLNKWGVLDHWFNGQFMNDLLGEGSGFRTLLYYLIY